MLLIIMAPISGLALFLLDSLTCFFWGKRRRLSKFLRLLAPLQPPHSLSSGSVQCYEPRHHVSANEIMLVFSLVLGYSL